MIRRGWPFLGRPVAAEWDTTSLVTLVDDVVEIFRSRRGRQFEAKKP